MRTRPSVLLSILMVIAILTGCTAQMIEAPKATEAPQEPGKIEPTLPPTTPATTATAEPIQPPSPTAPPAAVEPMTLKVWYIPVKPAEIDMMGKINASFEDANPGIKIEFTSPAPQDSFETILENWKQGVDNSTGPDIGYVWASGGDGEWAGIKADKFVDLTQYSDEMGWDKKLTPWEYVTTYNPESKVIGIPWDHAIVGVFYNKDLFKANNLEVPETWKDLETLLAAIKGLGIPAFSVGGLDKWPIDHYIFTMVHSAMSFQDIYNIWKVTKEGNFNVPGWIKPLKTFKSWQDEGYLNEGFLDIDYNTAENLFTTGKTAMMVTGIWDVSNIIRNANFEVGFFPLPQIDPSLPWIALLTPNNFWVVTKHSQNPDAAARYIDYLLSEQVANVKWSMGELPAFNYTSPPEATSGLQLDLYNSTKKVGPGLWFFDSISMQDLSSLLQDQIALVLKGKITPEEAMAEVQKAYEKKLAELGVK